MKYSVTLLIGIVFNKYSIASDAVVLIYLLRYLYGYRFIGFFEEYICIGSQNNILVPVWI